MGGVNNWVQASYNMRGLQHPPSALLFKQPSRSSVKAKG